MRKVARLGALAAMTGLAAALVSCTCLCRNNNGAGIPQILCQPLDQQVSTNQNATFRVKAKGENLTYRWLFQNANGITNVAGRSGAELVIPANSPTGAGFYSCVIDSFGRSGQAEVQTRWAVLYFSPLPPPPGSSNMLAGTSSTNGSTSMFADLINTNGAGSGSGNGTPPGVNICCAFCGWLNFQNSAAGWPLAQGQTFTFYLTDASGLNVIPTSQYCAIWRYGGKAGEFGCCTSLSSQMEQFTAPVTATYFLTIYFTCPAPPPGTQFWIFWGY